MAITLVKHGQFYKLREARPFRSSTFLLFTFLGVLTLFISIGVGVIKQEILGPSVMFAFGMIWCYGAVRVAREQVLFYKDHILIVKGLTSSKVPLPSHPHLSQNSRKIKMRSVKYKTRKEFVKFTLKANRNTELLSWSVPQSDETSEREQVKAWLKELTEFYNS